MKRKKILAKKEKETQEEAIEKTAEDWANKLSHTGEAVVQLLLKLEVTNELLERIAKAEEERNEIAREEYSDEDEEEDSD